MNNLSGKKILLAISGGIAAYKMPLLVRLFKKAGADVQVVITKSATNFVSLHTLGTLSGKTPLSEVFLPTSEPDNSWTQHISLGEWADVFVLAPATANSLSKLANGIADDLLSICFLTLKPEKPKLIFPSMDGEMYLSPSVQRNIVRLQHDGCQVIEPEYGELASGLVGKGRLSEPETIFNFVSETLSKKPINSQGNHLQGKKVVITAGATREKIDGVRFISNYASGRMGFALAEAAVACGAQVVLISGKTHLETPNHVHRINVETAIDMFEAAKAHFESLDIFIAAAAVADYRPIEVHNGKLKKNSDEWTLHLVKNPDILDQFGKEKKQHQMSIGFALEVDDGLMHAQTKLGHKNCDMIVLNYANEDGAGFEVPTNKATLIYRGGESEKLPMLHKKDLAKLIFEKANFFFQESSLTFTRH